MNRSFWTAATSSGLVVNSPVAKWLTHVWNTALLIGWDEPGGTYDHVPSGAVPPPDPAAPEGEMGFKFDRSGYRVPAIIASPWGGAGSVYNEEYRHTSLIATFRKQWDLGEAFTRRDASARTFDKVFSRETPRDPEAWATFKAQPIPAWHMDPEVVAKALSSLGKNIAPAVLGNAKELGVELPPQLDDPSAEPTPEVLAELIRDIGFHFFPLLKPGADESH